MNKVKIAEQNRIKNYLSLEKFIMIILLLLSLCGLIYQVQIIYVKFMSGKTIARIEINRQYNQNLPTITLCLPELFSMERAAQFEPGLIQVNEIYQDLLEISSEKAFELYQETFKNYSEKELKNNGLDMNVLFNNLSIIYKVLNGDPWLQFELYGYISKENVPSDLNVQIRKTDLVYSYFGDPFETIAVHYEFNDPQTFKCFTIFSAAQKQWRNFQAKLDLIKIIIEMNLLKTSFPISTKYYYLSIHSPNHLPELDGEREFKLLKFKDVTTITFSQVKIQRLGEGYDTDCHSYELDKNFSYYRMRSDCVNDCYQDKMRQLCKSDRGFFMSLSLLRKDQLLNRNQILKSCFDPDFNKFNFTLYIDCNKICKVECDFIYYPFEIEIIKHPEHQLRIRHGEYPDIFVQHLPEQHS